jgi:hypothetical protein
VRILVPEGHDTAVDRDPQRIERDRVAAVGADGVLLCPCLKERCALCPRRSYASSVPLLGMCSIGRPFVLTFGLLRA